MLRCAITLLCALSAAEPSMAQHNPTENKGGGVFLMNAHVAGGSDGASAARFLLWQYAHIRTQVTSAHPVALFVHPSVGLSAAIAREQGNGALSLPMDIVVHPLPLDKRRYHGSLLRGIVENMRHARFLRPRLEYAVVFSSRSLLAQAFDFAQGRGFMRAVRIPRPFLLKFGSDGTTPLPPSHAAWSHGARFLNTSLARAVGFKVSGGFHECLVLPAATVEGLLAFADTHPQVMADLYAADTCVEEFALTTIACSLQLPVGWADCLKMDKSLRDNDSTGDGSWTWPWLRAALPARRLALQSTCRKHPGQFAPPADAQRPATMNDAVIRATLDPCAALKKRMQAAARAALSKA
jgi:hypothetical protein